MYVQITMISISQGALTFSTPNICQPIVYILQQPFAESFQVYSYLLLQKEYKGAKLKCFMHKNSSYSFITSPVIMSMKTMQKKT